MSDCAFCTEFASYTPLNTGRVIDRRDGWLLIPTLGCFAEGYSLLMPEHHVEAVADAEDLERVQTLAEDLRDLITSRYGPTILAEHGPRGCRLGAGCCTHAHMHLIPIPDPEAVLATYLATGGEGRRLANMTALHDAGAVPYVYLSARPGDHLWWPATGFARQYVRRVCAAQHGLATHYDWRDHPFADRQQATLRELRTALSGPAAA